MRKGLKSKLKPILTAYSNLLFNLFLDVKLRRRREAFKETERRIEFEMKPTS
jgi:hypothetical protein